MNYIITYNCYVICRIVKTFPRSRSSSRSGSRSNSVKRSRSNSARRSRSSSSSRRKNRSDQSPTNQQKEYSAPKKILKNRNHNNQWSEPRHVPSLDPVEITSKIDDLLQKSNQLQAQMNNLQSHSQSAATISSGPFSKPTLKMIDSDISQSKCKFKN